MNYREHRIPGSLERHVTSGADEASVHERATRLWQDRGSVLFTAEDLAAMPWASRSLIEAEAQRIYGRRL